MLRQISSKNFAGMDIYIGLDVHQKSWKVCIMGPAYEHKTFSQSPDAVGLHRYLTQHFPGATYKAVYEAGFSGFTLVRELRSLGVDCIVVNPSDVPTQHKERDQKTDKVDARKLAVALRGGLLDGIYIPEELQRADHSLLIQRKTVVRNITSYKNRVKSYLRFIGVEITVGEMASKHWSKNYTEWLKGLPIADQHKKVINNYLEIGLLLRDQLKQINRQIRELAVTETYKRNVELLVSVPGIGVISAMTILTKIGSIDRFAKTDQLRRFFGIVPTMHNSGESESTGRLSTRAARELREIIIEASWTAVRTDPSMMLRFEELTKRMKKNRAIIRIARSLLNRIRTVLKNQTPYELGV
jgi:transposase